MAAYAAVVSLMYVINGIQQHPHPPASLHKPYIESLTKNLTFLQDFFESYSFHAGYNREPDPLEIRIADAAYEAEDLIESHVVDQIHFGSSNRGKRISSFGFDEDLQKVVEKIDSVTNEAVKIKPQLRRNSNPSRSSVSTGQNTTVVGFNDVVSEVMDKLIGGQLDRLVIPIVGMGGIGKTTLAKHIYENKLVVGNFDILSWATITQQYKTMEILSELLDLEGSMELDEYVLRDMLHKRLKGRRYLIVMDDVWDFQVWERLRMFFPDDNNGSRVVITTRISNFELNDSSYVLKMGFLDKDNSWTLFSRIVFGEEGCCPVDLERLGEMIVENCRGLPLSIVVVGGLLAKSEQREEYWEYVAENLNSTVNSEDDEHCLKVLHLSYSQLPVHLKPCFLYIGIFSEDKKIHGSKLIRMWVAEGFLKQIPGNSMEESGKEYLKELVDRNMVLVHQLGYSGNIKYCKVHDLLRDLCLRESQKDRFFYHHQNINQETNTTQRRVVLWDSGVPRAIQSMSVVRSWMCESEDVTPLHEFKLLRIMVCTEYEFTYFLEDVFKLVNWRYLSFGARWSSSIPSSVYLLWNLQTLDVVFAETSASLDIWNMPQLRYVVFVVGLRLPNPRDDGLVLKNLQKLSKMINFKCSHEVVKRIPNIKKLVMSQEDEFVEGHLHNLRLLHQLEHLYCRVGRGDDPINITLPHSLTKLTFEAKRCHCLEDVMEVIGSLPLLQKLRLLDGSFRGRKWETVEGQFRSLKFMQIHDVHELELWTTESTHFPRLEHLGLRRLKDLESIPPEMGEITTLKSMKLEMCGTCAIESAKRIIDDQEEFYGEVGIQVEVLIMDPGQRKQLGELASSHFRFI